MSTKLTGVELITKERARQVADEQWSSDHDDGHNRSELALAAACYALPPSIRTLKILRNSIWKFLWPWGVRWWKPMAREDDEPGRLRELVKAGALIAAEIDRLQRLK